MPISQRGVGRDHNPGAQTVLMAGAGIKGGQVDRRERRVRLQGGGAADLVSRPARDDAAPARWAEVQPVDVRRVEQRPLELLVVGDGRCRPASGRSSPASCPAGTSTTVAKGNMYSFLAIAVSGRVAVDDRRPQVIAALRFFTSRGPYFAVMSLTPASFSAASMSALITLRLARHGERRQRGLRVLRRQRLDRAERSRRSPRRSSCRAATPRCRSS